MRIPSHQRRIEADAIQHESHVFGLLLGTDDVVRDGRLADDVHDAHPRIERRVRVLEDHLHLELLLARRGGVEARQRHAPPEPLAFGQRQQADRQAAERRFAASGFADEPHHFAGRDGEIDVIDGVDHFFLHAGAERVADPRGDVERLHETLRNALQLDERAEIHVRA